MSDGERGRHQWVVVVTYGLTDAEARSTEEGREQRLDAERRLDAVGPACMNCEKVWSERLSRNPCPAPWYDFGPMRAKVRQL